MSFVTRGFLTFVFLATAAHASLGAAWQARTELGPDVWSRVLRIENRNSHSSYPSVTYATVFEFADVLWFYTSTDGTQSLSLYRGRLARDKADLLPLLREIDPGFVAYTDQSDYGLVFARARRPLANGCFIDSIGAWRAGLERGEPWTRAALLSYYVRLGDGVRGHTVLAVETPDGLLAIDPSIDMDPSHLRRVSLRTDPLKVARRLQPLPALFRAQWTPFTSEPAEGTRNLAGSDGAPQVLTEGPERA